MSRRPRSRRITRGALAGLTTTLAALGPSTSARGQEAGDSSGTVRVHGEVVDAFTRFPIARALVELSDLGRRTLTDSLGYFRFEGVPAGAHRVTASQLGYFTIVETTELEARDVLGIVLTPRPIALDAIEVSVRRIERRRAAAAVVIRSMDAEAILKTPALDAREVVEWIPGAFTRPCGPDECVMVRGRPRRLTVVVDEIPAWGGLQDLTLYTPEDLHSVEFVPSCAVVRVYTRWFIERMARRNIPLLPNVCSARW